MEATGAEVASLKADIAKGEAYQQDIEGACAMISSMLPVGAMCSSHSQRPDCPARAEAARLHHDATCMQ